MLCVFLILNYHFTINNLLNQVTQNKISLLSWTYFLFSIVFLHPDTHHLTRIRILIPGKLYGSDGFGLGSETLWFNVFFQFFRKLRTVHYFSLNYGLSHAAGYKIRAVSVLPLCPPITLCRQLTLNSDHKKHGIVTVV